MSLHEETGERRYLDEAEWLVAEVDRVLGRPRGIRIGEEPDRDGQYFHYLAMWLYALAVLGRHIPDYRERGSLWCARFMIALLFLATAYLEDERGSERSYPGYGFGALDAFDGYVSYRVLDEEALVAGDCRHASVLSRERPQPCRSPRTWASA